MDEIDIESLSSHTEYLLDNRESMSYVFVKILGVVFIFFAIGIATVYIVKYF